MRNPIGNASSSGAQGRAPDAAVAAPANAGTIDTFMWQADPLTLRLMFVSGQADRILGRGREHWLNETQPWHAIAGTDDRRRIETTLRRAVRQTRDAEVSFTAVRPGGTSFPARLAVRVARPAESAPRLWGLLIDESGGRRTMPPPAAPARRKGGAPPVFGHATRLIMLGAACLFATYALAISALHPIPAAPPASVAIQRADRLEQALREQAAGERLLESTVGGIELSVGQLVASPGPLADKLVALEALRAKIRDLIALTPPELTGRLRALLAQIERATPKPTPPAAEVPDEKPSAPPAEDVPAEGPAPADTPAPAPAPAEAPGPPSNGVDL